MKNGRRAVTLYFGTSFDPYLLSQSKTASSSVCCETDGGRRTQNGDDSCSGSLAVTEGMGPRTHASKYFTSMFYRKNSELRRVLSGKEGGREKRK